MAYTTIDDPEKHFNTTLYTGTLKDDRPIVGTGFQPDLIWFKNRNTTNQHNLLDSSRGVTKRIRADDDSAEATVSTRLKSFDSDGMTISTDPAVNGSGNGIVAWQWKANGGTTTSNDASVSGVGSLDSVYQANTTAGFSIVLYTGSGNAATIAHGLGVKPECILVKNRSKSGGEGWCVYHGANTSAPETDGIHLNLTNATSDSTDHWNDQAPTSTTFGISGDDRSGGGYNYVAYVFNSVQGYSKFGGYTGNGNADGPMVFLGFKPAFLIIKRTDSAKDWYLYDNKRNPLNRHDKVMKPNDSAAELTTDNYLDFLSNGFKIRGTSSVTNSNNGSYVYMAFAEAPFVTSNGTPGSAR